MSKKEININGGFGCGTICFVLFCIFMVLKLCGIIAWSWWWVTSPLWILGILSLGIIVFVIVILIVSVIIAALFSK